MHPLLVLDNTNFSDYLLRVDNVVNMFPFLKPARDSMQALEGCIPCQTTAKTKVFNDRLADAKRMVAVMPIEDKQRLRAAINAKRVRLYWFDEAGSRQRIDF